VLLGSRFRYKLGRKVQKKRAELQVGRRVGRGRKAAPLQTGNAEGETSVENKEKLQRRGETGLGSVKG